MEMQARKKVGSCYVGLWWLVVRAGSGCGNNIKGLAWPTVLFYVGQVGLAREKRKPTCGLAKCYMMGSLKDLPLWAKIGQNLVNKKEYRRDKIIKKLQIIKSRNLHHITASIRIRNFYTPKVINTFIFHLLASFPSILAILDAHYRL